ncbi:MAG: nucleotidyltransferase family protein [Planctomycetes bacterium]|nr:nucleotidyltransferase family protein [Planctomycetota bacterium]
MKALLLAAGIGARLRPITYEIPKCLAPVKGLPVLGHWLHLLEMHGFSEVLINTGYQAEQVRAFLDTFYTPLAVHITREKDLLGTGGTIKTNWDFFAGDDRFLAAHADNFTNVHLGEFCRFAGPRLGKKIPIALGLFRCPRPEDCGIVDLDRNQLIQRFHEKVPNPPGNLANAGIYLLHRSMKRWFDQVPGPRIDLCREVLPRLEGRMLGWQMGDAFLLDIGSPEAYQKANFDPQYRLEFPASRANLEVMLTPAESR